MKAKELIAAANELIEAHSFHPNDCRFIGLAKHILATVREDDDEPVTVEWLRETYNYFESGFVYQYQAIVMPSVQLIADACPGGWKPCYVRIGHGANATDKLLTRGQLRKLLEALGAK